MGAVAVVTVVAFIATSGVLAIGVAVAVVAVVPGVTADEFIGDPNEFVASLSFFSPDSAGTFAGGRTSSLRTNDDDRDDDDDDEEEEGEEEERWREDPAVKRSA